MTRSAALPRKNDAGRTTVLANPASASSVSMSGLRIANALIVSLIAIRSIRLQISHISAALKLFSGPMPHPSNKSNLGKWDIWYKDLSPTREEIRLYADATTYLMAAAFFADVDEVEDWGCGAGGFRRFCLGKYRGIDGSQTPFADQIADLCSYKSTAPAILLRHVLEHNHDWKKILASAVHSFKHKLCIVIFTPFAKKTEIIAENLAVGVDVPDISFNRSEVERHFQDLSWRLIEGIETQSKYGREHVYFIWRR